MSVTETARRAAPAKSLLLDMLRKMCTIRHFEERVVALFQQGLIRGATHVYLGEEAIAVGACAAISKNDYITSTHRGHGHVIAKGADIKPMMAELLGRATGYCGGKGGSMHIADLDLGILGANGVVGGGVPVAPGAGLSARCRKSGQVTLCFFGDGAINQGAFHEAINLAACWRLPVVFICENNCFALTTPVCDATGCEDYAKRADGYGIPGLSIDGNDVLEVYRRVGEAVDRARAGEGPTLIVARTYRWEGHYLGDPQVYRTKDEVAEWKAKEPIGRFVEYLVDREIIPRRQAVRIDNDAEKVVAEAEQFALDSPPPAIETLEDGLYPPEKPLPADKMGSEKSVEMTYRQAINAGLREALRADPNVILMGEDIGLHGGPFQVTEGLFKEFGGERVRNTPLSEAAIAGACVGAAITGLRPVGEIMYIDFSTIASDQIINQAAKMRYMFGGKALLPLVIRTMCGAGTRSSGQHSQSLEVWYAHIPGLKVVAPSTPADAKGLIRSAIHDDAPVIFYEFKRLYNTKGMVPDGEYFIALGKADIKRQGTDVTIVATSAQVHEALTAAETLANEGVSAEVVDPRTLFPLDRETILNSIRKTGRALVVHDAIVRHGFGAEVAAMIMEEAFDYLDAPVRRLGSVPVPMPYADELEKATIPNAAKIAAAVRELLG